MQTDLRHFARLLVPAARSQVQAPGVVEVVAAFGVHAAEQPEVVVHGDDEGLLSSLGRVEIGLHVVRGDFGGVAQAAEVDPGELVGLVQ